MLERRSLGKKPTFLHLPLPSKATTSAAVIAAMVLWISGAHAAGNQSFLLNLFANTGVSALLTDASVNNTGLTQTQVGGGLQAAGNVSNAATSFGGAVNAFADNANAVLQADLGAGPINQDITGSMGAGTAVDFGVDVLSANNTGIAQTSLASPAHNQQVDNLVLADSDVQTGVDVASDNVLDAIQVAGGPNVNQSITPDMAAVSDVLHVASADSFNTTGIAQFSTGGTSNQGLLNAALAGTTIFSSQTINTFNILSIFQSCLSDCNQNADVDMAALTLAGQGVFGTAGNVNQLGQTHVGDGPTNQQLGNLSLADVLAAADQDITSANVVNIVQLNGGTGNQSAPVVTLAGTLANQVVAAGAGNLNVLGQTAVGDAQFNQGMENFAAGQAVALAGQDVDTFNLVGILQNNTGGQGNQSAPVFASAETLAGQQVTAGVVNDNTLGQVAVAGATPSQFNQTMANGSVGLTTVLAGQNLGTGNQVGIAQNNVGPQGNQSAPVFAGAAAEASQVVAGTVTNDNTLGQVAVGPGTQFNQDMANGVVGVATVLAGQQVATGNAVGIAQNQGAGQGNQSAPVAALADSDADQTVVGLVGNVNVLGQAAVGGVAGSQANQKMGNQTAADVLVGVGQTVATGNQIGVLQNDVGGQGNQSTPILASATSDATQFVVAGAGNANFLGQTAVGVGDQTNQDIDNDSAAVNTTLVGQAVEAGNGIGVLQTDGAGQGNQITSILADADADGVQVVASGAGNANLIGQTGVGGAGYQGNQTVNNGALAVDTTLVGQDVESANTIGVAQIHGPGQGSQNLDIAANADTDAGQLVVTGAGNLNLIDQVGTGGAGDQHNQLVDNDTLAATAVGVGQTADSANNVGVVQIGSASPGAVSQDATITPTADVNANQGVVALSGNLNDISQTALPGSQANQTVGNTAVAATGVGVSQDADATNNVGLVQVETVNTGAGAQSADIDPTAKVNANQGVLAGSTNSNTIVQDPTGQVNQNVDNDSLAATGVQAGQDAHATNNVGVLQSQNADHAAAAQYLSVKPKAEVDADQGIVAGSSNDNTIIQDPTAQVNQDAQNDTTAVTGVSANQDADATNNVNLTQVSNGNHAAIAQAGQATPTATVGATQNIDADASNMNGIVQQSNGGTGNQGVTNTGAALTGVSANQNAGATNDLNVAQTANCTNAACAQYFDAAPTATTTANQGVDATSSNDNDIQQVQSGGPGNQQVGNDTTAGVLVDADQDATSHNTDNIIQVCTKTGGACAQYTGTANTANTDADQQIAGDASNDTGIVQNGTGGGNQDATSATDAAALIQAGQTAGSSNTSNTTQVSTGAGTGSQSAETANTAGTTATQNVKGNANNNTFLGQFNTGGGNQAAVNNGSALTTIGAFQNVNTANNANTTQVSTGGGSQDATNNNTATTNSNMNVNAGSSNNSNVIQSN